MSIIINFFSNLRKEFNKIIFPTTEEIWKHSVSILMFSIVIGVAIAVLDAFWGFVFSFVLK
jgi:preprotein translocase subunit SecE